MSHHAQLLAQARLLIRHDRRRPRQVNLRRAVSDAYYALFHALTDAAARMTHGGRAERKALRAAVARSFSHGTMRAAARSFAGGNLPAAVGWPEPVATDVRDIAKAFLRLQDARHEADYDLTVPHNRDDATAVVDRAEEAITLLRAVRRRDDGRLFLTSLLVWNVLGGR